MFTGISGSYTVRSASITGWRSSAIFNGSATNPSSDSDSSLAGESWASSPPIGIIGRNLEMVMVWSVAGWTYESGGYSVLTGPAGWSETAAFKVCQGRPAHFTRVGN